MAVRAAPAPFILLDNQTGGGIPLGTLQGHASRYNKEALLHCIQNRIPVCVVRVLIDQTVDGTSLATVHMQNDGIDLDTSNRIHNLVSDWQRSLPCTYSSLAQASAIRTFNVSSFIIGQHLSPDGIPATFLGIYPEGTPAVGEPPIMLKLGDSSLKELASLNTGQSPYEIRVLTDSPLSKNLTQVLGGSPFLRRRDAMQPAAHHGNSALPAAAIDEGWESPIR